MTTGQLLTFSGVVVLGAMSPGPDFAVVVRRSALAGRTDAGTTVESGWWAAFRDGLLCNALNPKAAVFFVALLPQFLPADAGLVPMLALSAIAVAITVGWFLTVANLVAAARRAFSRPATRRLVDGLSGALLIGLGVRLVFTSAR
ncbi:LysE family translocator [Micromonospora palythoicola]|uniref:LysE family translocator n=1 Tax=Micromonospora palythoicola TaxID=3120507 RepID=UPI002FCE1F0F